MTVPMTTGVKYQISNVLIHTQEFLAKSRCGYLLKLFNKTLWNEKLNTKSEFENISKWHLKIRLEQKLENP
jgi:hypothetical protein